MTISLLEQTKSTKFLYGIELSDKVHDLQKQKKNLHTFTVQSLSDMLQEHSTHYPYEVEFSDVRWDPVLILHSSGSTGKISMQEQRAGTYQKIKGHPNLFK